jgi:hypothetical protein
MMNDKTANNKQAGGLLLDRRSEDATPSRGGGKYDAVRLPVYNGISPSLNGLIFRKYPLLEILKQNRRK